MSSLALSAVLQISLLAAGANTTTSTTSASTNYADAYKQTQETGKPLVVLVGAPWCPGCQSMKTSTMPQLAARGGLKNVNFAQINTDEQRELAVKLMSGNLIPQLVMFEKSADGWKVTRLIGAQSTSAVEQFLAAAKPSEPKAQTVAKVGNRD